MAVGGCCGNINPAAQWLFVVGKWSMLDSLFGTAVAGRGLSKFEKKNFFLSMVSALDYYTFVDFNIFIFEIRIRPEKFHHD